jgi:hypothetical protein
MTIVYPSKGAMLGWILLSRLGARCTQITQTTGRISETDGCYAITGCFFYNLSDNADSAISLEDNGASTISTTTFLKCRASYYGDAIGACIYASGPVAVSFCCSRECSADMAGAFTYFEDADPSSLSDSSVVSARTEYDDDEGDGTSYAASGMAVSFTRLNYTSCYAWNSGSAFKVKSSGATWEASELTFLALTGDTCVDTYSLTLPSISRSNFYNNAISADWGVLYGHDYGMSVDSCIFSMNTRDIRLNPEDSPLKLFQLKNCVFSGRLPPETWWFTDLGGNSAESTTASFPISHFDTHYCPTNADAPLTPSAAITASSALRPTRSPGESASLAISLGIRFSPELSRSSLCSITLSVAVRRRNFFSPRRRDHPLAVLTAALIVCGAYGV